MLSPLVMAWSPGRHAMVREAGGKCPASCFAETVHGHDLAQAGGALRSAPSRCGTHLAGAPAQRHGHGPLAGPAAPMPSLGILGPMPGLLPAPSGAPGPARLASAHRGEPHLLARRGGAVRAAAAGLGDAFFSQGGGGSVARDRTLRPEPGHGLHRSDLSLS